MTTTDDPTLASLHRAVLAAPDDDTPRLVYADWLEESAGWAKCWQCCGLGWVLVSIPGVPQPHQICPACSGTGRVSDGRRERAEFIRVQCELAKPHLATEKLIATVRAHVSDAFTDSLRRKARPELRERETNLFMAHATRWFVPNATLAAPNGRERQLPGVIWLVVRCGFVSELHLALPDLLQHAADLFAAHPITTVTLCDHEPVERSSAGWSWDWDRGGGASDWNRVLYGLAMVSDPSGVMVWPTPAAARAALSGYLVECGRKLADLPPHTPTEGRP